jgi:hypothetical protein
MYKSLIDKNYVADPDYPPRARRIMCYEKVLDGTIYDALKFNFSEEIAPNKEYVKVYERRPSVRQNLCRTVVRNSASLLFGQGHWPTVDAADPNTRETLKAFIKETNFSQTMQEAIMKGSCGSVAIYMKVIKRRIFFQTLSTMNLTPQWDVDRPDTLKRVVERYKALAKSLRAMGYVIDSQISDSTELWFQRDYSFEGEIWYLPQTKTDADKGVPPTVDTARSSYHDLGFAPIVWIKNLPGGDEIDGACTFAPAIDTQIELEYQLSQAGRGLRYSSDPLLMIKEPPNVDDDDPVIRSSSSVLRIDAEGDAKLLEISGTAVTAVIEYAKMLRDAALEAIRGNRSSPDKLAVAQSGRAIELLYQELIWLADDLRATYGEPGLLATMKMVILAQDKIKDGILINGKPVSNLKLEGLALKWPAWFEPTPHDRLEDSQAISTGRKSGTISRELAVMHMAPAYDNEDISTELARIAADIKADDARAVALAATTAASMTTEN